MIRTLFKNPFTLWAKWQAINWYLEWKHASKKLKIGYLAKIRNSSFGHCNIVYDEAQLDNVTLGDYSYVGARDMLCNVSVGKFSCLGPDVLAGMGTHPSRNFVSIHPAFYSTAGQAQIVFATSSHFSEHAEIHIGNDVWVGARSIILDGVIIGDGAIIGAGSVVTRNVPPYAVVAGVPAKIVRQRFGPEQVAFLQDFKWWDKDIPWLAENYADFFDIDKLMRKDGAR